MCGTNRRGDGDVCVQTRGDDDVRRPSVSSSFVLCRCRCRLCPVTRAVKTHLFCGFRDVRRCVVLNRAREHDSRRRTLCSWAGGRTVPSVRLRVSVVKGRPPAASWPPRLHFTSTALARSRHEADSAARSLASFCIVARSFAVPLDDPHHRCALSRARCPGRSSQSGDVVVIMNVCVLSFHLSFEVELQ